MTARELADSVHAEQSLELERYEMRKAESYSTAALFISTFLGFANMGAVPEPMTIYEAWMGGADESQETPKKDPNAGLRAIWESLPPTSAVNETVEVIDG